MSELSERVASSEVSALEAARGRNGSRAAALRWAALVLLGVLILGFWLATRATKTKPSAAHRELPVLASVPEFSLTERGGRTVSRADLLGSVWVVDFFFANCSGPCPQLTARMGAVQRGLPPEAKDVRLVSISLDPESDRPEALRRYADRYHADPDRWWFLTGENERQVHELVQKGFLQAVARATPGGTIIHSTYFAVIDREGRIRSVHDGLAPESTEAILIDIESLRLEQGFTTKAQGHKEEKKNEE